MNKLFILLIILMNTSISFASEILHSVNVDRLNLRKEPSVGSGIVGVMQQDEPLAIVNDKKIEDEIDGIKGYWLQVITTKGIEGYVFSGYLSKLDKEQTKKYLLNSLDIRFCSSDNTSYECAVNIEKYQLKYTSLLKRDGEKLILKTRDTNDVVFVNEMKGGLLKRGYTYYDKSPTGEFVFVAEHFLDGGGMIMIDVRNGKQTRLWSDRYVFSASNKYMIVLSSSLESQYTPNGIQVVNAESGKIEFELKSAFFEPYTATWLNSDKIEIINKYKFRIGNNEETGYGKFTILKNSDRWLRRK